MTLHDTDSLILETANATESLPDPAAVLRRSHDLTNTGPTAVVWASVGATPFQVDTVPAATLTVPAGGSVRVQSDGAHWVVIRPSVGPRPVFAATAISDASGNAVFAFPAGLFPAAPAVALAIQLAAGSNPVDYRITALSATSCTVNVRQSPTLVVLSLSVLGLAAPLAGVTVHAVATPTGATG